jgi:hypothetical protein
MSAIVRCAECKHWGANGITFQDLAHRVCGAVGIGRSEAQVFIGGPTQDDRDFVWTKPTFGCVLGARK